MKNILDDSLFKSRTRSLFNNQKKRAGKLDFTLEVLRLRVAGILGTRPLCCYCNSTLTLKNISIDHSMPISRGGTYSFTNVDFICRMCNTAKGDLTVEEYKGLLYRLEDLEKQTRNFNLKSKVVNALKISHSFRQGAMRRRKKAQTA